MAKQLFIGGPAREKTVGIGNRHRSEAAIQLAYSCSVLLNKERIGDETYRLGY